MPKLIYTEKLWEFSHFKFTHLHEDYNDPRDDAFHEFLENSRQNGNNEFLPTKVYLLFISCSDMEFAEEPMGISIIISDLTFTLKNKEVINATRAITIASTEDL